MMTHTGFIRLVDLADFKALAGHHAEESFMVVCISLSSSL